MIQSHHPKSFYTRDFWIPPHQILCSGMNHICSLLAAWNTLSLCFFVTLTISSRTNVSQAPLLSIQSVSVFWPIQVLSHFPKIHILLCWDRLHGIHRHHHILSLWTSAHLKWVWHSGKRIHSYCQALQKSTINFLPFYWYPKYEYVIRYQQWHEYVSREVIITSCCHCLWQKP